MSWTSPCLIVDVTDVESWRSHPGGGDVIPDLRRPTVLQPDRGAAEAEGKRLAARFPDRSFAIFEACLLAKSIKVPTHITLGGKVVQERLQPQLVEINADQPPF